jgi:hypothetical protein
MAGSARSVEHSINPTVTNFLKPGLTLGTHNDGGGKLPAG